MHYEEEETMLSKNTFVFLIIILAMIFTRNFLSDTCKGMFFPKCYPVNMPKHEGEN